MSEIRIQRTGEPDVIEASDGRLTFGRSGSSDEAVASW